MSCVDFFRLDGLRLHVIWQIHVIFVGIGSAAMHCIWHSASWLGVTLSSSLDRFSWVEIPVAVELRFRWWSYCCRCSLFLALCTVDSMTVAPAIQASAKGSTLLLNCNINLLICNVNDLYITNQQRMSLVGELGDWRDEFQRSNPGDYQRRTDHSCWEQSSTKQAHSPSWKLMYSP